MVFHSLQGLSLWETEVICGIWTEKRIFWNLTPRSRNSQAPQLPSFVRICNLRMKQPFQHRDSIQQLRWESYLYYKQACIFPSFPSLWKCISFCRTRLHEKLLFSFMYLAVVQSSFLPWFGEPCPSAFGNQPVTYRTAHAMQAHCCFALSLLSWAMAQQN